MHSEGISNLVDVCLFICSSVHSTVDFPTKNIDKINNQLKYTVIHSVKGAITMFELFFEGHSNDSTICVCDLCELKIQSFLFFNYNLHTPPL